MSPLSNNKSEFLGTAFRAAMLAGDCILRNMGKLSQKDIDTKQASDFVTRVDKESESLILSIIGNKYPDHHFLAEETVHEQDSGQYRWIIDPLDGTTNFIHSYPVFSVSIALQCDGDIILGLVYDPIKNELFSAEKGKGSYLNGNQIMISSNTEMANSLIATGFPFRQKGVIDRYLALFKKIFHKVSDIRRAGSAALDFANLACGRCDGFFEIGLSPWDIAAGSLLIHEAGGIVTDFGGGTDYLFTGNVVAGVPEVHGELLKDVQDVFGRTISR
jgi:myo-inositol-1(or 4)-monophosphatase